MASPTPIRFDHGSQNVAYSPVSRHDRGFHTLSSHTMSSVPGSRDDLYAGYRRERTPKQPEISSSEYHSGYAREPKQQDLKTRITGSQYIVADAGCLIIPLALLGFAIATLIRDGDQGSEEDILRWANAASILSTLFPVLFAAIVGRLAIQAARWKLEQGSKLGALEQLLSSRTVGGALLSPFLLSTFNLLTFSLILLWSFSPLGAQAILRIVELRLDPRTESSNALYFDTRAKPRFPDASSPSTAILAEVAMDVMGTIYSGALLAPMDVKKDTVDMWGNVKIPLLSSLDASEDDDGWRAVPKDDIQYSALIGIPMLNITTGNTTFALESNYMNLSCERVNQTKSGDFTPINKTAISSILYDSKVPLSNNTFHGWNVTRTSDSVQGYGARNAPWSLAFDRLVAGGWANGSFLSEKAKKNWAKVDSSLLMFENEDDIEAEPARLLFQSKISSYATGLMAEYASTACNLSQTYIESKIRCSKTPTSERETCFVLSQRPSRQTHPPSAITLFSFPKTINAISRYLPLVTGPSIGQMSGSDVTLQYLEDPSLQNIGGRQGPPMQLDELDAQTISTRLTQALNSYMHISQMYANVLRTTNGDEVNDDHPLLSYSSEVKTEVENLVTVYHVPKLWAALCIGSCLVLLAGGTASVVFARLSVGPEVLGYASAVVRDNVNMRGLPDETPAMDGVDISKNLRDLRVRFGVSDKEDGGRIGVGSQETFARIKDVMKAKGGEGA